MAGISCTGVDTQSAKNVATALLLAVAAGGLHQVKGNPIHSAHSAAVGLIPDLKVQLHSAKGATLVDLKGMLDGYVEAKKGLLSKIQETFAGEEHERAVALSRQLEGEGVWPVEDRLEEARALIARFDTKGTAHCTETFDSQAALDEHRAGCRYRLVRCESPGCEEQVSACRLVAHDAVCPRKLLDCTLGGGCGARVARAGMEGHVADACPNRAADCPYKALGCLEELTVGGVEGHVRGCAHAHLGLVAEDVAALRRQLEGLEGKVLDMMKQMGEQAAAMKASQALLDKDTKELKALQAQGVAKTVAALEKEVRGLKRDTAAEIAKVYKAIEESRD